MAASSRATYEGSGVNLDKAETFLGAMLHWVTKTDDIPGAGLRPLIPNGYYATVLDCGLDVALALTTDGVGSKILVAEMVGDYTGIGIDCIAMNVNDLICVGARPLAMVDYLAIQDPPVEVGDQVGRGLYEGARQAGISIPGGELAQLPEMIRGLRDGHGLDLAGAAVGLVPKEDINHGQDLRPGDVLLGMASNGLHSNGYTLARSVLLERAALKVEQEIEELGCTLGEELVRPTTIYVPALRALWDRGLTPRAAMHITGGGFLNLLRASTQGIRFELEDLGEAPPIFDLIEKLGNVSKAEMHRVFNMGVGMVLVVSPDQEQAVLDTLQQSSGPRVWRLGQIAAAEGQSVELKNLGLIGRNQNFAAR